MSESPLATLARWASAGAHWRVRLLTNAEAEVQLLSCLREPVDHFRSADPELLDYFAHRSSSELPTCEGWIR